MSDHSFEVGTAKISNQNCVEESFMIPRGPSQELNGLICHVRGRNQWALICRGLTGSLSQSSSLDETASNLGRSAWSSLPFDYSGSLKPSGDDHLRSIAGMVEDIAHALASLINYIGKNPDAVIARGFSVRLALEALVPYPDIPLIMWAPILWLRTSLELRGRLHELRRYGQLEFDNTEISKEFVDTVEDPTDDQIRSWIRPELRHVIIQGVEDQVSPLKLAEEAKRLIELAGGKSLMITVLGGHPHPGEDVKTQIAKIVEVLSFVI